ncbi:Rad9/Ddc1 [Penicillium bovifimosum]|uniref:DNA repair protein rad9 n=1 Tax=Penicillium bovifimosum TaxID=126998 RepID=A0A9W9HBV3_9EURO|nr:Rad9/Ddc1 [Penicillium bovifimosum]KAJ5143816.1 Rad9/Ddc1 [Penicillium bovifimosum]
MTSLSLSLSPPALVQLHDALICLSKFSETVSIEAEPDLLRLSALNSTKTGFASFAFEKEVYFQSYSFEAGGDGRGVSMDRFFCQIYIKASVALLSIFRGRIDRNKDTAVERCDMELHEDLQQTECRLTVKMICGLGVIKSYKLTYEPAAVQHAVFDKSKATSMWAADPRFLKQVVEHFSPSAEQLDMYSDSGKAVFTSFTTKITEGKEVLKHPVHTSVAADKRDFQEYWVEENMHVAINLKDFKAVVAHAETANATVTARYTRPCKPLQLAYSFEGITAEFTVMTRGQADGEDVPTSSRATIPRQTPAPVATSVARPRPSATVSMEMLPPPPPRSRSIRPLNGSSTQENLSQRASTNQPLASGLSMEFDALFVPADDDREWDEMNEEEEPQDILGWDASGTQDAFGASIRDAEPTLARQDASRSDEQDDEMGLPPTQRLSQVRRYGLFD